MEILSFHFGISVLSSHGFLSLSKVCQKNHLASVAVTTSQCISPVYSCPHLFRACFLMLLTYGLNSCSFKRRQHYNHDLTSDFTQPVHTTPKARKKFLSCLRDSLEVNNFEAAPSFPILSPSSSHQTPSSQVFFLFSCLQFLVHLSYLGSHTWAMVGDIYSSKGY